MRTFAYMWIHVCSNTTGISTIKCATRYAFLETINKWNSQVMSNKDINHKWVYIAL